MTHPKLYLGPVSKNTVDAAIKVSNSSQISLGLIPSRRQVDLDGGYTGWNTKTFATYVKSQAPLIVLERDHGGSNQGYLKDFGVDSFLEDLKYLDIIHIDPFRSWNNILEVASETVIHLQYLHAHNPQVYFEIGTEAGIMSYRVEQYRQFLDYIFEHVSSELQQQILYLVVQGGTEVKAGQNIGNTNHTQLADFISLCQGYGKLSKEHNGDYLTLTEIKQKFELGLSAINIAPEFGSIESEVLWSGFVPEDKKKFVELIIASGRWKKWFSSSFNPEKNPELLTKMCGHYVFEEPEFLEIKNKYPDLNSQGLNKLESRISELLEAIG